MALITTILVVGVLLSIVFVLSAVFIPKIRVAADNKYSVTAVYAAESGLEWCLYEALVGEIAMPVMGDGAWFDVVGGDCLVPPVKVIGHYKKTVRAFEIYYE